MRVMICVGVHTQFIGETTLHPFISTIFFCSYFRSLDFLCAVKMRDIEENVSFDTSRGYRCDATI